jgi:hypothetical protein
MNIGKPFNVNVYGLNEALVASGYPMKTSVDEKMELPTPADMMRMNKLGNTPIGSGHDNALNGIVVQFDVTLPVKVWTELQRYHFVDFVSSQSTMHRLAQMDLKTAFDPNTDERVIEIVKELQDKYNATGAKEDYLRLLLSCPVGLLLTARMTTNYRQLKTVYKQRRNHRLPHWHVFCEWIEQLPYVREFGVIG